MICVFFKRDLLPRQATVFSRKDVPHRAASSEFNTLVVKHEAQAMRRTTNASYSSSGAAVKCLSRPHWRNLYRMAGGSNHQDTWTVWP